MEPQKKRKRTLVRKSAATVLSSPESVVSMDDSEESDFVVGDDSESADDDMDVDASEEEEDSPPAGAKKAPAVCTNIPCRSEDELKMNKAKVAAILLGVFYGLQWGEGLACPPIRESGAVMAQFSILLKPF